MVDLPQERGPLETLPGAVVTPMAQAQTEIAPQPLRGDARQALMARQLGKEQAIELLVDLARQEGAVGMGLQLGQGHLGLFIAWSIDHRV